MFQRTYLMNCEINYVVWEYVSTGEKMWSFSGENTKSFFNITTYLAQSLLFSDNLNYKLIKCCSASHPTHCPIMIFYRSDQYPCTWVMHFTKCRKRGELTSLARAGRGRARLHCSWRTMQPTPKRLNRNDISLSHYVVIELLCNLSF